jgi:hypothetical protein
MSVNFPAAQMNISFSQAIPSSPLPYFGRDPLFDRRKKVDDTPATHVYESSGRIVSSPAFLPEALKLAKICMKEARQHLMQFKSKVFSPLSIQTKKRFLSAREKNTSRWRIELETAKIRKANVQLAKDISPERNKTASQQLRKALKQLNKLGYLQQEKCDSSVVHGLASLGCYTFTHDVYKATENTIGAEKLKKQEEETFEGMSVDSSGDVKTDEKHYKKMISELPMLEKAITLSERMQASNTDRLFAKAQYLTRKGEIHHGLAHLGSTNHFQAIYKNKEHSQKARESFQEAINAINAIPVIQKTPHHAQLLEQLQNVKAPHLCQVGSQHIRAITTDGQKTCNALQESGSNHVKFQINTDYLSSLF